jgi:cytidylate kinase
MIIAIDGPAGAGKSTIAKLIAKKLGILYLDTGAMYRAVGLKALNFGVDIADAEAVEKMLLDTKVDVKIENGIQKVYLDGNDVSEKIREHQVSKAASDISAVPCVRYKMVELQREIAAKADTVLDGRDIGTFVLPNAEIKIFLTASVNERAQRRYAELKAKGVDCVLEDIKADIEKRDYNDTHRALAPLKKADDAVEIDTTGVNVEGVTALILKLISERK